MYNSTICIFRFIIMNKKNCKLKEKKNQKIEFVKKTISHLRGLNLADSNIYNCRLVIDTLIGSNY